MKVHVIIAIVVAVILALVLALYGGTAADRAQRLELAVGYGLAVLIFLFGFVILLGMATGDIDISSLLGEHGSGASMSRFQLMIFTFVIAMSLLLIVAKKGEFPSLGTDVLTLLGISATTYGVSKGIQAANPNMPPKESSQTASNGNGGNGGSGAGAARVVATTVVHTETGGQGGGSSQPQD